MELEGWKVSYLYTDLCCFAPSVQGKYISAEEGRTDKERKKYMANGRENRMERKQIFGQRKYLVHGGEKIEEGKEVNI